MLRYFTSRKRVLSRVDRDNAHRDVVVEGHEVAERHAGVRRQVLGHRQVLRALDNGEQGHLAGLVRGPREEF